LWKLIPVVGTKKTFHVLPVLGKRRLSAGCNRL
jgi:hypothetical protein